MKKEFDQEPQTLNWIRKSRDDFWRNGSNTEELFYANRNNDLIVKCWNQSDQSHAENFESIVPKPK
jgi:hypothetical protein